MATDIWAVCNFFLKKSLQNVGNQNGRCKEYIGLFITQFDGDKYYNTICTFDIK
jgi:hypothetical protein